jgi:hypothetical protein
MPIDAAEGQSCTISTMLIPLLEAATQWMEQDLPLDCIKVVAHPEVQGRKAIKAFS